MDKNLKRRELMALGVHDLRNIARTVGVVGPTMKVKKQLVEEIVEIMAGEMQASSGVKRGRKAKANFLTGDAMMALPMELSAILQAKEQKKHAIFGGNLGYLSLNQNSTSEMVELVDKQGFLLCENGVFYFFDDTQQKSMVYVPTNIGEKFGLNVGDKILVKCQKMPGNNVYLAKDVLKINSVKANEFNRSLCQFDNFATTSTKWFCEDITEGELKILPLTSVKDCLEDNKKLFEFCAQNNIFVMVFGIDCSLSEQENLEKIVNNNGEVMQAYTDAPENCFEALVNVVNNSIIRAQSGQKVLVMMLDFDTIFATLQSLTSLTNLDDKDIKSIAHRIQNLNRILKNNGSLTTLVFKN